MRDFFFLSAVLLFAVRCGGLSAPLKRECFVTANGLPCIRYFDGGTNGQRVLLIHGTFHDGRCWDEYWMPELAARGFEPWAVSLRGTQQAGGSEQQKKVRLGEHVDDVAAILASSQRQRGEPWVIVAHSFGGPVAMELLRLFPEHIQGVALLCSVPPTGNVAMTWRTVRRSLREAWLITRGFALKTAATNVADARALFFHKSQVTDANLSKFVSWFAENSKSSLDLRDFQKNLPALTWQNQDRAFLASKKRLVVGAANDLIVDDVAVKETAAFLEAEDAVVLPDAPHDLMLDPDAWRPALDVITTWITSQ
mmetsp:Transcript_28089/g.90556  ORF Transcript_28089/g.90556 Transcript_28089/m.90556 type:complete len:310 (-) Transcript_28089:564-1493(-)